MRYAYIHTVTDDRCLGVCSYFRLQNPDDHVRPSCGATLPYDKKNINVTSYRPRYSRKCDADKAHVHTNMSIAEEHIRESPLLDLRLRGALFLATVN